MMIFRKIYALLTFVLLFAVAGHVNAQSTADNLFMEGQTLQQTMTVPSQNAAIKKFQSAKTIYKVADKKKMCDNQIALCKKNIATIKGYKTGGSKDKKDTPEPAVPSKMEVSKDFILFDGDQSGSFTLNVEAPTTDWSFSVPVGVVGMDNFLKVTRSNDAKAINISVDANNQTLDREQVINVDYNDQHQVVKVRQLGKTVTLSANYNNLDFNLKGGKKSIEVYTNSDSIIATNYDQTWYVESKPDWVEVAVEVKKSKGILGGFVSAVKTAVGGSATAAGAKDTKTSEVKIIVKPIDKQSAEYNTGRKGQIVFATEDKRFLLNIQQSM